MDEKAESILSAIFDGVDLEAEQAAAETDRAEKAEAVTRLEKKYADRGLKFTSGPHGAVPVQAYGEIDGLRFYFRYRGGTASLRLGPYDIQVELDKALRELTTRIHRAWEMKKKLYRGEELDHWDMYDITQGIEIQREDDPEFYPLTITRRSAVGFGEELSGWLDAEEFEAVFAQLAESLQDE